MDLISELKREMELKGYTNYSLSKKSGISEAQIGRILSGKNIPKDRTLRDLKRVLELNIENETNESQTDLLPKLVSVPKSLFCFPLP